MDHVLNIMMFYLTITGLSDKSILRPLQLLFKSYSLSLCPVLKDEVFYTDFVGTLFNILSTKKKKNILTLS